MIEAFDAFSEVILELGCLGGLVFLGQYMHHNPKDWLMWLVIGLTFVVAILSAIGAYRGVV